MAERIGRYDVLGQLATGGMAEILLGRLVGPSGFERVVVIKRILPHLARERAFVDMFLDEARTVARIRHPNVVQVHELDGRRDGRELYLVMEYLEGESAAGLLRRLCLGKEQLDPSLAAHIIAESCRGLHAAHELTDGEVPLDVVHRDVSPQNIFITYAGSVKVLDFGIARAADRIVRTEAGQVKGKFAYMSPEQCLGEPLDRRSDVFALGAVLYELLTARRVFKRPSEHLTFKAICEEPVPPPSSVLPSVPPELEAVCLRALAHDREDRYATAADMRRDLLAAMRALGSKDDPEERLAALMRAHFAERIEEKQDMLRRARALSPVTHVPSAETDRTVDLPSVREAPTTPEVPVVLTPVRRRGWRAWSAAGLVVLALLGTLAVLARTREPTPAGASPATTASAPAAPTPTLATTAAVAAPLAEVTIHLETTPAGARASIAGREIGLTPIDARLPRGSIPVELSLRRAGFETLTTTVRPDVDQRLLLTLRPARANKPAPSPAITAPVIEKLP